MSSLFKTFTGIVLSLLCVSVATADEPIPRPILAPIPVGGYGYGYGYAAGTTAHESINRGRATLIKSIGVRRVLDSESRLIDEETRARRIDNALKAQQTRIAMRRLGEAEQNLRFEKVHARRMTTMALNDAHRILQSPSTTNLETRAEARLRLALELLENGRRDQTVTWLEGIVSEYGDTPAADQAAKILEGLSS